MGHICRTKGGFNACFFESADADDYNSDITVVEPINTTRIVQGAAIKQVAPDRFSSPIALMRRYMDSLQDSTITESQFSLVRVKHVNSLLPGNPESPVPSNTVLPEIVQPIQGAGPAHIGCTVIVSDCFFFVWYNSLFCNDLYQI